MIIEFNTVKVIDGRLHIPYDADINEILYVNLPNNNLTSLEGFPEKIEGGVWLFGNKIRSLEGCPKSIGGDFNISENKLTSLEGIHLKLRRMDGMLKLTNNPLRSHILGLLKIKGLKIVKMSDPVMEKIINKYLPLGDILDCQEELIEAGYGEFAQL